MPGRNESSLLRGKGFPSDAFDRICQNLIEVHTELVNGFDTFRTVLEKGLSLFGGDCLQCRFWRNAPNIRMPRAVRKCL